MKRIMVQHTTAAGLHYATFHKPRRKVNPQRVIDKCMTAVLVFWLFALTWYGAAVVLPGVIR